MISNFNIFSRFYSKGCCHVYIRKKPTFYNNDQLKFNKEFFKNVRENFSSSQMMRKFQWKNLGNLKMKELDNRYFSQVPIKEKCWIRIWALDPSRKSPNFFPKKETIFSSYKFYSRIQDHLLIEWSSPFRFSLLLPNETARSYQ